MNSDTHPAPPSTPQEDKSRADATQQPVPNGDTDANWPLSALKINRTWLFALILLGAASLAALLFIGDPQQTLSLIRNSNGMLLFLALLIHYSSFAIRGLRWKLLLGALGHPRGYLYCTGILISGWFVSAIVPARAGDLLRIGILHSSHQARPAGDASRTEAVDAPESPHVPITDGLSSILLERVFDLMAILLLGASFGFMVMRAQLPGWVVSLYGTTVVILGVLGLVLMVLPRIWVWLGSLSEQSLWQKGIKFGTKLTESIALLSRSPGIATSAFGLSLYIWLSDAIVLWLVMWSLGSLIDFGPAAFVALTVDVTAAVPLTPGGVGQIETAYGALLTLLSLPTEKLPAIILLTRFINYWSFLLVSGLVTLLMLGMPNRAINDGYVNAK